MSDAAANDDLSCPLCNYNLRGLETPRCPECGYAFDWDELRRTTIEQHPYLFEHHPRRNIRSLLATFFHGLRPAKFWRSVQPAHAIRPRRLAVYALLFFLPAVVLWGGAQWIAFSKLKASVPLTRASYLGFVTSLPASDANVVDAIRAYGSLRAAAAAYFPDPVFHIQFDPRDFPAAQPTAFAIFWLIGSPLALLIFQASMRRSNIRFAHVVRCIVYSFDLFLPTALALIAFILLDESQLLWRSWVRSMRNSIEGLMLRTIFGLDTETLAAMAILTIVLSIKLAAAYRSYLRFPHAIRVVAASQFIVLLAMLALSAVSVRWLW